MKTRLYFTLLAIVWLALMCYTGGFECPTPIWGIQVHTFTAVRQGPYPLGYTLVWR